jgi:hypothetical protein
LPHKADSGQGDPHVGALGATIEPAQHVGGRENREWLGCGGALVK